MTKNYKVIKKVDILESVEEENLNYNFHKKGLQTGDLILFTSHSGIISKLISFWTKSKYVHVGIVIKDVITFLNYNHNFKYNINMKLDDNEYGLLECAYENKEDMDEHTFKYGVQITSLKDKLQNYSGKSYWRKLNIDGNPKLDNKQIELDIYNIYQLIKNKPYDINILDLFFLNNQFINNKIEEFNLKILADKDTKKLIEDKNENSSFIALKNWFKHDTQKIDRFICSSLVAFIYTKLTLLPLKTEWTEIIPSYFSDTNKKLKLTNFVELENEIEL